MGYYDHDQDMLSAAAFPLPFRVLFLICLGILGWATNLHLLHKLGLNATGALDLRFHDPVSATRLRLPANRNPPGFKHPSSSSYSPVYRLFVSCSIWCFTLWCIYRYATYHNVLLVDVFKYIPAVAALGLLIILFCPFDALEQSHRDALFMSLRRCVSPVHNHRILFCDVILADIFTSYAKIFGDLWLSLLMVMPGGSLLVLPPQEGWSRWICPTLISIPYLIRFRQCMIEYTALSNQNRKPLYNAIKYASSFPVIYLSAAQRTIVSAYSAERVDRMTQNAWQGGCSIFRLWLLFAFLNSVYSFWWDATNDWGFSLLLPKRVKENRNVGLRPPRPLMLPSMHSKSIPDESSTVSSASAVLLEDYHNSEPPAEVPLQSGAHPFGLRPCLLLPLHFYPFIILCNLILRLVWLIKLSPHLQLQSEGSLVIFWTEVAELIRRWMWVFLRVEWEIVKESEEKITRRSGDSYDSEEFELVPPL